MGATERVADAALVPTFARLVSSAAHNFSDTSYGAGDRAELVISALVGAPQGMAGQPEMDDVTTVN